MEIMDKRVCKTIWRNRSFDWSFMEAEGNSGGILTIWNTEVFLKVSEWYCRGMIVVNGRWLEDGSSCSIINVYAPNNSAQGGELWELIHSLVKQYRSEMVCIIWDFNAIREENERACGANSCNIRDMENFKKQD
ncbi:hypothetical protein ACS0TY_008214 [Phlomoides rotata]